MVHFNTPRLREELHVHVQTERDAEANFPKRAAALPQVQAEGEEQRLQL